MDEKTLLYKISWIIGFSEHTVKNDLPPARIIEKLVKRYEQLAEEMDVNLYDK